LAAGGGLAAVVRDLAPRQGAARGGAEPRRGAAHGHPCRARGRNRIRAVRLARRHRRHSGRAALHHLVDHGHAVRHQGFRGRHSGRHRKRLGCRARRIDLRRRRGADHSAAGLDLHADRHFRARHPRARRAAERAVRARAVEESMSAIKAAAAVIAVAVVCFLISRGNNYQVFIIVTVGLTAIVGIGLNVLLGLNGQISLGHVAFYAIGAYTVGILTTTYEWSFWPAFVLAGLIAGIAGVLLAIPALKVRGPYLAMVTIAFGFVVEQGAAEWQGLTGGWNGLSGIPGPSVFGHDIGERGIAYLTLALVVLATAAFAWLSRSVWGNAMRAVRDSESASVSIGLDPTLVRTAAFGISAGAAGLAGGVYASISNFISPESFPFFQ